MPKLTIQDLYHLEKYIEIRNGFRARVIAHKKDRRVVIGDHAALYFEDALTMQYQIQEMLRIERIVEIQGIEEELAVYNPLIPDGSNWKATFMMEYPDERERRMALALLIGIENCVYIQIGEFDRVYAICNEDIERSTENKTSAVHFMRFEFTQKMIEAAYTDAIIWAGVDHPQYKAVNIIDGAIRASLLTDLLIP